MTTVASIVEPDITSQGERQRYCDPSVAAIRSCSIPIRRQQFRDAFARMATSHYDPAMDWNELTAISTAAKSHRNPHVWSNAEYLYERAKAARLPNLRLD